MIKISKQADSLLLTYVPDRFNSVQWLDEKLRQVGEVTLRRTFTPRLELAGSVMQAEKYLFHLSKWGQAGELEIFKKRKNELPPGIEMKITNPKALILLGRDNDFSGEQRFDFEIIRRKYANMIDFMTYDDLLRRLKNIIAMMKRNVVVL